MEKGEKGLVCECIFLGGHLPVEIRWKIKHSISNSDDVERMEVSRYNLGDPPSAAFQSIESVEVKGRKHDIRFTRANSVRACERELERQTLAPQRSTDTDDNGRVRSVPIGT